MALFPKTKANQKIFHHKSKVHEVTFNKYKGKENQKTWKKLQNKYLVTMTSALLFFNMLVPSLA